jgi:NAD(P)H-nitrite reductase large subunit
VTNVHPDSKSVDVTNLATGEKMTENFDALVLSTGASAIIPPVPGVVDKDGIPR